MAVWELACDLEDQD